MLIKQSLSKNSNILFQNVQKKINSFSKQQVTLFHKINIFLISLLYSQLSFENTSFNKVTCCEKGFVKFALNNDCRKIK